MTQRKHKRLCTLLLQCSPQVILRAADLCDGHTIFDPAAFTEAGLPNEIVEALMSTHQSDGSPKGTIYIHGQAVEEITGIYGLHVLRLFASVFGVECPSAFGRGKEAQNIREALHRHFQPPEGKPG